MATLNYSFVHIQNSLTNLARDNKFFTIFCLKNEVSEAILNTNKRIISRKPFLHRVYIKLQNDVNLMNERFHTDLDDVMACYQTNYSPLGSVCHSSISFSI